MRIQSKILILVVIILCIFLTFLLIYKQSHENVKKMLAGSDKRQKETLISSILTLQRELQFAHMRHDLLDAYNRSGLNSFQNRNWLESNLTALARHNSIDYLWVFNAKGDLLYSYTTQKSPNPESFTFSTLLFDKIFQKQDHYFYKFLEQKCIAINCVKLNHEGTGDQSQNQPVYILAGKVWDAAFLSQLGIQSDYLITLKPYDQNYNRTPGKVSKQAQDSIISTLDDENERPVIMMEFARANQNVIRFEELSQNTVLYFFLLAGLMTLLSLLLLRKWIRKPLQFISSSLRTNDPSDLQELEKSTSEFGEIAQMVENFYTQKKMLEDEMEERKKIEDVLRKSEEKNKALLKAIPDYMFIVDENGMVIDYNSQPNHKINLKISEFLNHRLSEILPESIANEALIHERETLQDQETRHQEFSLNIDGQIFHYEARFTKCSDTTVLIMVRDMTELRSSEDALRISEELNRAIVEGSPLGITVRSNTGKLLAYNRAWRKIWAISDEAIESDLNKNREEMQFDSRDDYLDKWQEAVQQVYEKGGTLYIPEAKTLGKRPGSAEWIAQYFYAIMAPNGQVDRVVILTEDISERKRAQLELLTAKEQAEDANRAKTVFLANMSHEMRTPLNGILGMVQIIMDRETKKENLEHMGIIQSSAQVLLQLITQILDYSKLEAENLKVEEKAFLIRDLLIDIQKRFQGKAKQKKISLEFQIDEDVPQIIHSDAKRITQVLANLIDNGIKYSSAGSVKCNVRMDRGMSNVSMLHFMVKDQGVGIPFDKHDLIFKSFIQPETDPSQTPGGTGLGLSICKRIVEQMNGRIWLESQVGKGATFHVIIPISLMDGEPRLTESRSVSEPKAEMTSSQQLKVIVAEDNLINQKVLSKMLERMGHQVGLAMDGKQAIALWEQESWDLILMDIQMPEMNGIDATMHIREMERTKGGHTPIIAVTAYAMAGDREKFLVAGMDEYIPKPINVTTLQGVLQKITEWKKS